MNKKIDKLLKKIHIRRVSVEESLQEAISSLPRITNDTVAEHREEVLASARKFIYPLKHSRYKVVIISSVLLLTVVSGFFVYSVLALYKFQTTSTFMYRVTQIIPFPIAKAGPRYVSYENYLFELRRYMHYYETQQRVDFNGESGREQLAATRQQVLDRVINDAYTKQLAEQNNISVSDKELDAAISLVRSQNKLGSNENVYKDVLREFWDWSPSDFRRDLNMQLLTRKVVTALDKEAKTRADVVSSKLAAGADFAAVAAEHSDDQSTKSNGGDYGMPIVESNRDLPPAVISELFKMKPGDISGIINAGTSLEILKLISREGDKVQAAHVSIAFKSIDDYIQPLKDKQKPNIFIGSN